MQKKIFTEPLELFKLLAQNNETALNGIIQRYEQPILHFAAALTNDPGSAIDVYLHTIEQVWINREKLAGLQKPSAWIFLVTKNKALNFRNSLRKQVQFSNTRHSPFLCSPHPFTYFESRDLATVMQLGLKLLSPEEKKVFHLHLQLGLSYKTIALHLGKSESTIRSQNGKALKKLRQFIGRSYYD